VGHLRDAYGSFLASHSPITKEITAFTLLNLPESLRIGFTLFGDFFNDLNRPNTSRLESNSN
jgi:hypothetical protein